MTWYIEQDGQPKEIPQEVLVYKIENGELSPDTLAVNEIIREWTPLKATDLWRQHAPGSPIPPAVPQSAPSAYSASSENSGPPPSAPMWKCSECGNTVFSDRCELCGRERPETDGSVRHPAENKNVHQRGKYAQYADAIKVALTFFLIILFAYIAGIIFPSSSSSESYYVIKTGRFGVSQEIDAYMHKSRSCCEKKADFLREFDDFYGDVEVIRINPNEKYGVNEYGQTVIYKRAFLYCLLCSYS